MQQITETNLPVEKSLAECFHCGEPVYDDMQFTARINNVEQPMCCTGCKAVAETICSMGLADYYRHRTEKPARPDLVPELLSQTRLYDRDSIQAGFVTLHEGSLRNAEFIIEGLVCPACAWLIESRISRITGVNAITVNYTDQRCQIRWDQGQVKLSEVLQNINALGYRAQPYSKAQQQKILSEENRSLLRRIGVAGILGMQIMMIAVALYQAEWSGMENQYRTFFHYVSLVLCIPILVYSAEPFFKGAWRDIRFLHPGMDVPVVLGLVLAFSGSVWTTVTGQGHVYYESVAMFVFFLLLGRYFEFSVRKKINSQIEMYSRIVPVIADKLMTDGSIEPVAVADLNVGDTIRIKAGESVPLDCRIIQGGSMFDESVITGESKPLFRTQGEDLLAGSINMDSPVDCNVTHISSDSFIAKIQDLVNSALTEKSAIQKTSNKIASWFIIFVLVLSILVSWYWINQGSDQWLAITISVLIITCPCALALAMPVAITAMTGSLMKNGILSGRQSVLEILPKISHIVFDKTGTLTEGDLSIERIETFSSLGEENSLMIAATIEQASEHPVARAFIEKTANRKLPRLIDIRNYPGAGLSARYENMQYFIGSVGFIQEQTGLTVNEFPDSGTQNTRILLADNREIHCCFYLCDQLREEAHSVVQIVKDRGIIPVVMSGDRKSVVSNVCHSLGIEVFQAELKPEDKLSTLHGLQSAGNRVLVIGDGINDGPVLAAADLSVAMGQGSDLVKNAADIIFLNNSLNNLVLLQDMVLRTRRIIHQNICWAVSYNLLAIPAAVTGLVAPWLAALGMSLSSLAVVLNSARLGK